MSEKRRAFEEYAEMFSMDLTRCGDTYECSITNMAWRRFLSGWKESEKMTERERFEAWAIAAPRKWFVGKDDAGEYVNPYVYHSWCAWQARCPDGYSVVPTKITAESGHECALIGEFSESVTMPCPECECSEMAYNGCEFCQGDGDYEQPVPIEWHTIKRIHDAIVLVAAAPQPGEES